MLDFIVNYLWLVILILLAIIVIDVYKRQQYYSLYDFIRENFS